MDSFANFFSLLVKVRRYVLFVEALQNLEIEFANEGRIVRFGFGHDDHSIIARNYIMKSPLAGEFETVKDQRKLSHQAGNIE